MAWVIRANPEFRKEFPDVAIREIHGLQSR
jgi:hypothetical protein